jgi:hypothetical protein
MNAYHVYLRASASLQRRKKIALVEQSNGTWKDLAWGWYGQSTDCHPERSEGPHKEGRKNLQTPAPLISRTAPPGNSPTKSVSIPRSFAALRMTNREDAA